MSGLAFSSSGPGVTHSAALVVSFATTAMLWRIYIDRAGELLAAALTTSRDPILTGLWAVNAHLIMVAGIVVTAVGQELVIAHPLGRTRLAWTVVLLGGPALFLAGRALFEYTVFARVSRDRPIGLVVLAAAAPATRYLPPLLSAATATAVLAAIALADGANARRRPIEPSPVANR